MNISGNLKRLLSIANSVSKESKHNYQMGAVIFKHGKVLSKGFNKTNRGFSGTYGHWAGSCHAEIAAIIAAKTNLKGARILVSRKGGGLSRPCAPCLAAIKEAGIKWVYYTNVGGVDKERI